MTHRFRGRAKNPNIVFIFADQWRQQATGYAGDPNVKTPHLDALAAQSIHAVNALSGCPVCSPYRASLLTGQRPLTHGVFVNDVCLRPGGATLAEAFRQAGYDTAYIGKWHLDGHGRSNAVPPERRRGFDYWKVLECTHDYPHSLYYSGDQTRPCTWGGYDALAQTRDACAYLRCRDRTTPFLLLLSWGPPHNPYATAPSEFCGLYRPESIILRSNVPDELAEPARQWLAGYYAHCSALDAGLGLLRATLQTCGLDDDTILVFTSDHGDMLGSQGEQRKQRPWDESLRVPFLLRYPGLPGPSPREIQAPMDAPDIMPTLLGLCGLPIPAGVEGLDFSGHLAGGPDPSDGAALITCVNPFGEWTRDRHGGREYRGLRTACHTYVRDRKGPWLLYDNQKDPFQMRNLVMESTASPLVTEMDKRLSQKLRTSGDAFLPGAHYIEKWGYRVNADGTVPYSM